MKMISGVSGSIIMSLTPAVTALGAVLFFHESLGKKKIFAFLLGIAGVLLINIKSGESGAEGNFMLGSALVFAAILCEAAYTLFGKAATKDISALKLATISALLSGVFMLPAFYFQWDKVTFENIDLISWIEVAWWGIGTMALGSLFWYSGVAKVPGHLAAGFMIIMPVSAVLLSYFLLNESFRWIHVPGFGLALAGTGLIAYQHYKKQKN